MDWIRFSSKLFVGSFKVLSEVHLVLHETKMAPRENSKFDPVGNLTNVTNSLTFS